MTYEEFIEWVKVNKEHGNLTSWLFEKSEDKKEQVEVKLEENKDMEILMNRKNYYLLFF